jgi:hypothetical protein
MEPHRLCRITDPIARPENVGYLGSTQTLVESLDRRQAIDYDGESTIFAAIMPVKAADGHAAWPRDPRNAWRITSPDFPGCSDRGLPYTDQRRS